MDSTHLKREELLAHTADIVASHVANNSVALEDLPGLIENVFKTLAGLDGATVKSGEQPSPAVPINQSITPDYLICLEDGKQLKMLKRHLKAHYNLTPEAYRARWGLAPDYPMVAPNYAKERRRLAKEIGLGRGKTAK